MIVKLDLRVAIQVLRNHNVENLKYIEENKKNLPEPLIEMIEVEGLSCKKVAMFLEHLLEIEDGDENESN